MSLSILLLGVGIASVTDLQLNLVGTILSFMAILTTCISQIVCNIYIYSSIHLLNSLIIKLIIIYSLYNFSAHKHNTEEAQCVINSASVPVISIPSSYSLRLRPFLGPVPHQEERLRLHILPHNYGTTSIYNQENYYIVYLEIECDIYRLINAGFHNAVLLHCCICELQHISGDRENISSYLSSIRASENMPCSWIWVHSFAWSLHCKEHSWNSCCHCWNGIVLLLLHSWDQEEATWWPPFFLSGNIICDIPNCISWCMIVMCPQYFWNQNIS